MNSHAVNRCLIAVAAAALLAGATGCGGSGCAWSSLQAIMARQETAAIR